MKRAKDLMTAEVFTATPDTDISELAKKFTKDQVSGYPVVDDTGKVVGVVTESDLIHQNEKLHIPTTIAIFDAIVMLGSTKSIDDELNRMTATKVSQIMSTELVTIAPDATLSEMATIMGDRHVHTLPVVDGEGTLVGVVGKRDLIRAMA